MAASGFVLAGGRSRRMGRDKALLPYRGRVLVEHVAGIVREALGAAAEVAILGDPDCYRAIGYPVHPDQVPNCGPLGGIVTALSLTKSEWNLVVACDMPMLVASSLRMLVERALESNAQCVAASGPAGELEPLCAVYHSRCLARLDRALRDTRLKMKDLLPELQPEPVSFPPATLANVNTPDEWTQFQSR
jgi:molybdenum cofactor guanylyltransferase